MAEHDDDKTQEATPKRLQEAREKGQVARSGELSSVIVFLTGAIVLYLILPRIYANFFDMTHSIFTSSGSVELKENNVLILVTEILKKIFISLSPFLFLVVIAGILSNIIQFGFVFSSESLVVDLSRINPLSGFKRFVSFNSFVELMKSMAKIVIVGFAAYHIISNEIANFSMLANGSINYILAYMSGVIWRLIVWTGVILFVLAGLDYGFRRYEHKKSLRMTKEEVKEEFKQMEGDPIIKSRIRSLQVETARKRMMADVPNADVVITNPIHLAVALSYKHMEMNAPKVVAKGAGIVAEKIKEIAREHGITVVENKPLAQILYRTVDIGKEIPENLYKAVAEILAYVYRLRGKV